MRGKPGRVCYKSENRRITPAGAGKTVARPPLSVLHWDHPRRCGENEETGEIADVVAGSPPQVRGKRIHEYACAMWNRITPAGAEKTENYPWTDNVC